MLTFSEELLIHNIKNLAIAYTSQNALKANSGLHDPELAFDKRAKANELLNNLKNCKPPLSTKINKVNSIEEFENYKRLLLSHIEKNYNEVEDLCIPKKVTMGCYAHFSVTVSFTIKLFFKLCSEYELSYQDLSENIATNMKLAFFKTIMDYELEAAMLHKFYENHTAQVLKDQFVSQDKHEEKILAMRQVGTELNQALKKVHSSNQLEIDNTVLLYLNDALIKEQAIQNGTKDSSEIGTGTLSNKLTSYACGAASYLFQTALNFIRTPTLNKKLSEFKIQLVERITQAPSLRYY